MAFWLGVGALCTAMGLNLCLACEEDKRRVNFGPGPKKKKITEKGKKTVPYNYLKKAKLDTEPSKVYVLCDCKLLCRRSRADPERWVGFA